MDSAQVIAAFASIVVGAVLVIIASTSQTQSFLWWIAAFASIVVAAVLVIIAAPSQTQSLLW